MTQHSLSDRISFLQSRYQNITRRSGDRLFWVQRKRTRTLANMAREKFSKYASTFDIYCNKELFLCDAFFSAC